MPVFLNILFLLLVIILGLVYFCVFFDQAVLTRSGTVYRVKRKSQRVALTFDDGPSPLWTPLILDELKRAGIKAAFFMVGHHVKKYPNIARRVAQEGHIIGNHGFAHNVILYYTFNEVEEEIKYTEQIIREATGQTTKYFRPPKAWVTPGMKTKIKSMGYDVVLWSLNSKDWVTFNHKYIVKYISRNVRSGDIILFHDSGNVFSPEGGDRAQTVAAIPLLAQALRDKGFEFISLDELLDENP